MILKSYRVKIKPSTGLDQYGSFLLEISCLKKLEKDYECICNIKKTHFPKLLKIDSKHRQISLTNRGKSVKDIIDKNKNIKPINVEEQMNCIIHNLKKYQIRHLDMAINGKNMCINKKGTISLIDFDYASVGDKYMSPKIQRSVEVYGDYDKYLEYFTKQFMIILNKVK